MLKTVLTACNSEVTFAWATQSQTFRLVFYEVCHIAEVT